MQSSAFVPPTCPVMPAHVPCPKMPCLCMQITLADKTAARLGLGHGDGELWGLAAHPSANIFVTAGDDKMLRCWDMDSRALLTDKCLAFTHAVRSLPHGRDGRDGRDRRVCLALQDTYWEGTGSILGAGQ